jgi:hypothetical protein
MKHHQTAYGWNATINGPIVSGMLGSPAFPLI